MKRGLIAVLAGALAAALLVPVAGAKPGNGNGNGKGHGPPAWAGSGAQGPTGGGRLDRAGKSHGQEKKAERQAARGGEAETGEDGPKHMNPAWMCKFERDQMGAEAFAEEYGENENKAKAFGKCVSREAHDRDGVTEGDDEAPAPGDETPEPGESSEEEPEEPALPTAVQAFLHYLWPLFF